MSGVIDLLQLIRETTCLKEFVDCSTASRPMAIIIEGDETPCHNGVVECVKAEFHRLVPVRVDIEYRDLFDRNRSKSILKPTGYDAHATQVRTNTPKYVVYAF